MWLESGRQRDLTAESRLRRRRPTSYFDLDLNKKGDGWRFSEAAAGDSRCRRLWDKTTAVKGGSNREEVARGDDDGGPTEAAAAVGW
ncbi:hypothetical protein Drorol1_Dr00008872 [Drosera rotundifolia]